MRVKTLLALLLLSATFIAGCGGPKDSDAALAEACQRQIAEVEAEQGEGNTPTAKSTTEKLESTTLIECAGQEVVYASGDEEAEHGDDAMSKDEGDEAMSKDEGDGEGDEAADEGEEATDEPAELDPAARETFVSSCGGCHTLDDAGTSGAVGPNLDEAAPDADTVTEVVTNGRGAMPAGLLSGDELDAVAQYVADAAAQS